MAGEEFKVRVGVELDDASFNALKNQINGTVQKEPIKVKVDTKDAENNVKSLKTQIESLGKTNISLSGTANIESALNDISSSVKEIKTSLSSLNGVSVKPKIDTTDVDKGISNVKSKINNLDASGKPIDIKANTDNFDTAISSVSKKITVTAKNVSELRNKLTTDFGFDDTDIDKFVANLDKAVISVNQIKTEIDGDNLLKITVTGEDDVKHAVTVVKQFKKEFNDGGQLNWNLSKEKITSTDNLKKLRTEIEAISNTVNNGKLDFEIKKIKTEFEKLGTQGSESILRMDAAFQDFENSLKGLSDDPASMQKVISSYKDLTNAMSKAGYEAKNLKLTTVDEVTRATDVTKLKTWMNENTKAAREYGNELNLIIEKLSKCENSVERQNLLNRVENIKATAQLKGDTGLTTFDRVKKKIKEYTAYFSVASAAMQSINALRQMYSTVLDIDTAMTELYRVTDLSSQGYSNLFDNMISSAKEYGATLSDIINSTADWSRAGFDADTANNLAGITMMYEHIADVDYEEATQNLLTTYKGFEGQLSQRFVGDTEASVTYIADILNELDNNYAVTAAGVGEAMRRSAASMDVANNSIEQTAALITGAIEVTQDPESAGNALKVVSMRLRGAKGELEDLGEEVSDDVENLTQMQGKILNLTHGKVNIFEDNGDFRSTYDILVDIADVYDQLNDIERADLLETIAGKHRANTVASIIGNIDNVKAAYQSATEASGSASKENAKYMDSIQGRLNQLTTAWQSFSNSFMSSNFLKGAISAATGLLNILDSIVGTLGTVPTILGVIAGGLSAIKNVGIFNVSKDATGVADGFEFMGLKGKLSELFSGSDFNLSDEFVNQLELDKIALKDYIDTGGIADSLGNVSNALREYIENTDDASLSIEDFVREQRTAEAAGHASENTFVSAKNVMAAFNAMQSQGVDAQRAFANQIAQTNPRLGAYLSSLNGTRASMIGYGASLVGATAKTVALTVASAALNAAITMGISFAISAVVSAISSWINRNEELADSVADVIDKYNEQKETLKDAKSVVDEVVTSDGSKSRYEELSKGVDSLGRNVSLTADEYSKYLEITNRIASTFPELIQGYDSQGNAILSCKGNVDQLTKAYEDLAHAANNEVLNNIDDIQEDFKNDVDDLNDSGWWNNKLTLTGADILEEMVNADSLSKDDVYDYAKNHYNEITSALKDAKIGDYENVGISSFSQEKYIADCINNNSDAVMKIVNAHRQKLDDAAKEMKQAAEVALSEAFDFSDSKYADVSDVIKTISQQAVSGLDGEFYKKVSDNGGNILDYINSMVEALAEVGDEGNVAIETAFDLQTKFNNGEVSYGEYADALAKAQSVIDNLEGVDGEIKSQLKLAFDTKDAESQYKAFVNRLTESGWSEDAAKEFARTLNSSEMEVAFDLVANGELKIENADELRSQIEEQAKLNEAMSFSIDMEAETSGIEAFTTALTESNSATGLTVESMEKLNARYKDLDGYNPATLFQETANGLMLNVSAARELEKAYAESKLAEVDDNLTTLKQRYDELGVEIQNCDDASKKASLINERESLRQQIVDTAEYATALKGLTSAYNDWQAAESAGNNRDMYSNIYSAMDGVKEELNQGWIDDGTKEYFDLIWGDNWDAAGKSVEDYRAQWDTLDDTISGTTYSLQDFFKTDEDGNLTSSGIYNFFDAVRQKQEELGKDWVQTDANGNITSFNFGVDGTKAIADALGISEDLVNIFLKASQDCGFVVNFDGTYKQLADLQNEAIAAADKLKELGMTDYSFNFDSRSIEDLNNQLAEAEKIYKNPDFWNADGTFNFGVEGATEAMTVMSTLQATIDNLDNKYIGLTVDDSSFKEPLEKLQEYESTVADLNQFELNPKAKTEEIEAAQEKLHEIVDYFYNLSNEEKINLGIDVDASWDEIQTMIENGEIEIPAALDIQTSINDNLEDLVKLSLINSGLLNEDEKLEYEEELRVKYKIGDDSDTQEDAEKLISDNFSGYEGRQDVEIDVNADVKGEQDVSALIDYLGTLSDEEIKVIANVIGKVDVESLQDIINGLDDKTVQAIAEALGAGDVESLQDIINGLDDKTVQAIAEALGYDSVEELKNAIAGMNGKTVQAIAKALGISDVESLRSVINSLNNKTVQAIAKAIGAGDVKSLISTIAGLKDKTVTVKTVIQTVKTTVQNVVKKFTGGGSGKKSGADGTAYADGTVGRAFKQGDWGTNDSGKALVGELGQELLVRDGHYYTIGDNGAEFIDYKKGDIIFNAGQTKQLFEQGKITNGQTRGRAYAGGNVFDDGFNGSSLINLSGITGSTGVFNLDVSPINEDAISTLEEYNALLEDAIELGYDFNGQTVFGNIDTNSRQVLEWTDENINTYHDALKSWGNSDEDIADMKGSISTVMGSWGNFGENGEYEIAFSPMLQTDDGPVLLSADTVNDYINGLIAEASEDGVVTVDELIALDARGEGDISGLIAAVGDSADVVSQLTHYLGPDGAIAQAVKEDGIEEDEQQIKVATFGKVNISKFDDSIFDEATKEFVGKVADNSHNIVEHVTGKNQSNTIQQYASTGDSASGTTSGSRPLTFDGNNALDTLDKLNDALAESESETGLTADGFNNINEAFKDLKSYDPSKMFIKTAKGVKVSQKEFAKCKQELVATKKEAAANDMSNLVNQYNELTAAIGRATDAKDRADNIAKRQTVKNEIGKLLQQGIAYSTQNSKYSDWLNAQSLPEGKDAYSAIAQYKSQVTEDMENGWFTNSDKAYVGLLTGLDAATASTDEAYDAWKSTFDKKIAGGKYSIQDLWSVDDDGNVTSDGVDRFMEGIETDFKDEIYKFNEDTGEWYYDFSEENLQKIQDTWGMGIDSIGLMLEAASQAGYDINWSGLFDSLDFETTPVEQLISLAELAEKELSKLGKDVDFNFSASNLSDATSEIEKARSELSEFFNEDGTINFGVEGADKVAAIMATLIIQKNQLTAPAFMTVDTSQLTGANTVIGDYIAKAQQFQEAMENYRIAAGSGNAEQIAAASDELSAAATDYQNAASALSESNPDVAVKLNADDAQNLAIQVQDALNNSDATVQAKAEITQGVTDKLAEDITVPAVAQITGVSESKLVNEDAYNASVDVQLSNVTSGIPGVEWDGSQFIFSSEANIAKVADGANGDWDVSGGTGEVAKVADGANGDWDVSGGTGEVAKVADGANGDWDVSGGTATVAKVNASGATVHADTLIVDNIEVGSGNENGSKDGQDESESSQSNYIAESDNASNKTGEDVFNSQVNGSKLSVSSDIPQDLLSLLTDDELGIVIKFAYENSPEVINGELPPIEDIDAWKQVLKRNPDLYTTLLERTGKSGAPNYVTDVLGIYEGMDESLKPVFSRVLKEYGIDTGVLESQKDNNAYQDAINSDSYESGIGVDDAVAHLSSVFNLLGALSNEDFSSAVDESGLKDSLTSVEGWSNYLSQLADNNPKQFAKYANALGYDNVTEDNAQDYKQSITSNLNKDDAITLVNSAGIQDVFESKEAFNTFWNGMDDAGKTAFSGLINSLAPQISQMFGIDGNNLVKAKDVATATAEYIAKNGKEPTLPEAIGMLYDWITGLFKPSTAGADEADRIVGGGHSTASDSEVSSTQSETSDSATISAFLVANKIDTSGVAGADGAIELPADAEVDGVDDPSGVLSSPFQIAVDNSGIQEALQDGDVLREKLLSLDNDSLMAFGNIAPGFQDALGSAEELRDVIAKVPADGLTTSFSAVYSGLDEALTSAESLNEYLNSLETDEQRQVVIDLILSKDSEEQEPTVTPVLDSTQMDSEIEKPRETTAVAQVDDSSIKSVMNRGYSAIARITPQLTASVLNVAINTTTNASSSSGSSKADGTAYVNGTVGKAFKHGNWGTGDSGTALVGELGQEMVVRDGQFFTIGDNGAEFFQYKKNDIIFNAGQTKQLFEQGKITNGRTRGRAFANGWSATATENKFKQEKKKYMSGSSSGSSSGSGSDSSGDSSDEADDFSETLDWIETKLDRIERAISKLDTTASSVYKNWGTRNEALANQISKVGEEINLQQRAYDRYLQQANSIGLSEDYASKVRDGTIDIETITDEDLNDKISQYKEWYEKALDCADAIVDLKEKEAELYKQRFDNVETKFSGVLGVIEHEKNILNEFIDRSETKGWLVSTEYYKALGENEKKNIAELEKQRDEQIAALNEAVASGKIEKYSESWYEMCNSIDETTESIEEGKTALEDYKKSIRELEWKQFDLLQDRISRITSESEFLIDLLSSDELYDDKGQLTDSGKATMGLHGVNYNVEMAQADKARQEAAKIKKELEKDPYNQDLLDRYNELIDSQQEHIKNAQSEKEAIKDLVKDGIEKELDALQDLIDKRNDALDAEKDLYNFQKKVKEQTEEISSLQKQLSSYEGDDSEETMQKIQQIKVDLESAKDDLEETEYEKYIDDQQKMLDDLYDDYSELLNERLDNLDQLVADMTGSINDNATTINSTIQEKADSVGYTLSDSMKTIWNTTDLANNTNGVKTVITTYGEKFSTALTTTNLALSNISKDVATMIGQLNKVAKTNVKSASTSSAATEKPKTNTTTKKPTTTTPTASKGDGVPKIGDKVKFTGGWYYYDSQGTSPAGHQHQGEEVYITNINTKDWATHGYHISTGKTLGDGDLGWLKLNQLSGYASGKKNLLGNEAAWTQESGQEFIVRPSDGAILTPLAKGDSVLTAAASSNIWDMANNPADFIKSNIGLDNVGGSINRGNQTSVEQNFENIVFNMPNVKNYDEMLSTMKKDRNFERLINAMTIDRLNGGSSLAKGKAIR